MMIIKYLKKIPLHSGTSDTKTQKIVQHILSQVEQGGDEKVIEYAAK
tara:strand:+ start:4860 stop:5000 length:141 start_codon:yes stop_codon:yes gene_type:complete